MPFNQEDFDESTREVPVLAPGTRVANYEIQGRIGAGGMGEVYLAHDEKLKRSIALKFMPIELNSHPDARARFLREARAAASLNHPNIVTVHEVGEWRGRDYIVMEYVAGKPLSELIRSGPLDSDKVIDLLIQIADGLGDAHSHGVIHRDIKGANILLDSKGRARLVDFGLAAVADEQNLTQSGTTMGTVNYMSPEQVKGLAVDQRSDIFSLGVVTYELLTGELPFKRNNSAATLNAILNDDPKPLDSLVPDLPPGLKHAVELMLCKDIERRLQAISELPAIIRSGGSTGLEKTAAIETAFAKTKPAPRRRHLILIGALLVGLLSIITLGSWGFLRQDAKEGKVDPELLAIMYFKNLVDPGDSERLGEICTNLLITSLSESHGLRVLSSQRLFDLINTTGNIESRSTSPMEIARSANANWMLTGTIVQAQPNLVLTAQLVDLASGEILSSHRSTAGSGEDIFAQLDRLGTTILERIGVTRATNRSLATMTTSSQEAYRHYLAGVDFCRRGFPFEGRGEFELALKADSTMAMAYYWLVRERLDVSRSAEYIGKALRYSENLPEREQLMIKALAESHNGNLQAAANILERLCLEDTSDYATLEEYALALNQLPEIHDSVIAIRKRQIAAFPEKHEFLDVIAGLFKNIRVFDSALVYSARQVALAPGEPRSHDTHAEVLLANGKYEEAIHSYRTSLSLAPTYHSTLVVIGKLYAHLGDSRRSDSCVLAHMRAGGADHRSTARLNLANPLRYSGEFSKTIQILNDGINSDSLEGEPSRTRTYTQKFLVKAIALDYLGRTEEALEVIEAAKRVARDIAPIEIVKPLHYEAIYRAERGNLEAAQAAVDSADSLVGNRRSGLVYSFRTLAHAWVFYRKGDVAHAIDDFLAPKNKLLRPVWEHYLARLYVEIGQPKDAIPLLQDWLARIENVDFQEPEMFVTSHYYLGRAYESLGESDSAIVHYSRFLNYWGKSPDDIPLVKDTRNRLAQLTS